MTLQEIERQLATLLPAEKAQIVRTLALDIVNTWPGVERVAGVAGGDACVVRTRIPIWALENYRRLGLSEARILENYPTLRAADLVNAWAYVDAHRSEIDTAIQENEAA